MSKDSPAITKCGQRDLALLRRLASVFPPDELKRVVKLIRCTADWPDFTKSLIAFGANCHHVESIKRRQS